MTFFGRRKWLHIVLAVVTLGLWLSVLLSVYLWRRGRHVWAVVVAAALVLLVAGIALAPTPETEIADEPATLTTEPDDDTATSRSNEPQAPVTAETATGYRQLFKPGQTTAKAARPACSAYRSAVTNWSKRAVQLDASSRGADADPFVAEDYLQGVSWLGASQAEGLQSALDRISRSRLRTTTRRAASREEFVKAFTRDALYVCRANRIYHRTRNHLELVDRRGAEIISLAANKPWYPQGFQEWNTDIAWRWVDNPSCDYFTCWQIRVVSQSGCPDGLYAELNVYRGDVVIDYSNDSLGSLPARTVAVLEFTDTNEGQVTGRLTDITCY